jgi:hypothetical protein
LGCGLASTRFASAASFSVSVASFALDAWPRSLGCFWRAWLASIVLPT